MNYRFRKHLLSIYIVFLLVSTGFIGLLIFEGVVDEGGVEAATLIVGSGQTYTKIQDAIDNATNGDTIRVWDGSYNEGININKQLSILGNGTTKSIINGSGHYNTVQISANWVNISGFTIKNADSTQSSDNDGGIKLNKVNFCNIFRNNNKTI